MKTENNLLGIKRNEIKEWVKIPYKKKLISIGIKKKTVDRN